MEDGCQQVDNQAAKGHILAGGGQEGILLVPGPGDSLGEVLEKPEDILAEAEAEAGSQVARQEDIQAVRQEDIRTVRQEDIRAVRQEDIQAVKQEDIQAVKQEGSLAARQLRLRRDRVVLAVAGPKELSLRHKHSL